MTEIKLEKRYPHSRTEDITDAFMRGYQQGKEDEHRWWSNHCANCKDTEQTEPQIFICPIQDDYEALIEDEPQTKMPCYGCEFSKPKYMEYECLRDSCKYEDEPQTERRE